MINRLALLADLQKFLQRIEADLLERSESTEVPEVPAALHAEYEKAAKAERTAQNYEDWRTDTITQAAAAWVLSCVFVRFLEDNSLIDPPKIAGPGERLARARDEHELYFRSHPQQTDREYLLYIFSELANLPGTRDIFGEHNAINDMPNWLSGDAAGELLSFFQKIDASTGDLLHDFTDLNWDTRFLGDLYQDLSEAARKKFALLQTPDFIEEFILDRTLDPAIEVFGLVPQPSGTDHQTPARFKMIDPACGSGHFLLGSFPRILHRWMRKEPTTNVRELVQRTLASIHGVDINPFAIAIARFRLLLAALKVCDIRRLADAPGFKMNLACGDSLYHGRQRQLMLEGIETDESHYFKSEDAIELKRILREGTYHAVVANPPYITPKDESANKLYRRLYSRSCRGRYALSAPFIERIFALGISEGNNAGFTGQITSNSFMKAEFGKLIVEDFLPKNDLTHIIDTSGAYIPGHGVPTVILLGRNRLPTSSSLRVLMGIRGEPSTPDKPANGKVWNEILSLIDSPKSNGIFVSVDDVERKMFSSHPWSIGGGGGAELKNEIELTATSLLESRCKSIGYMTITGEDSAFVASFEVWSRLKVAWRPFLDGESIRDWRITPNSAIANVYSTPPSPHTTLPLNELSSLVHVFWPLRETLRNRLFFGKTPQEAGREWHEYGFISQERLRSRSSLFFAFIATHNHFVHIAENTVVANRTAPLITLGDMPYDEVTSLCGVLNSSVTCFWMKQSGFNKGDSTDQHGARTIGDPAFNTYNFNSALLKRIPLPTHEVSQVSRHLMALAVDQNRNSHLEAVCPTRESLILLRQQDEIRSRQMIRLQEDLDWECYRLYGLLDEDLTYKSDTFDIQLGERAFEIVMAHKMTSGELETTWFERHGSTPITELPEHWPEDYKALVHRRIEVISSNPKIALIEQPEYKRRWNTEPWASQIERALREWLLLRLETYFDFDGRMTDAANVSVRLVPLGEVTIYSVAQLADAARREPQFMEVGELYRDDPAFDVQALVEEFVLAESVPHLPILRYKDSGLRKRAEWEKTWDLQRREDAGETVGTIPVPPKYTSADFISTGGARYWSLRGKLDVPKERWISFPHCEGPDGTLVICWAGYDHLQQAQAISAYYVRVQTEFGGSDDPRLIPLLASLIELIPWLKQWHNEPNANFDGLRMGDYFEGFVNEEARNLGKTLAEIKAWVPPARTASRGRRKAT